MAPSKKKASSAAASPASSSKKTSSAASKTEYQSIADQWAKAKAAQQAADAEAKAQGFATAKERAASQKEYRDRTNKQRKQGFERRWYWTVGFWVWLLLAHVVSIWLFTSGFLLTRFVLEDKSACDVPPIASSQASLSIDKGCWHPKQFDRAVVILIDALRYDFTVPVGSEEAQAFHNAFPFLHEMARQKPQNAFLRPFIADPPTTTLQRLKGLTTGTLPTFIDAGSNFAGTAIDEDNLLMQLRRNGKKIAHLGDDTWHALFPGYFEESISRAYDSFNVWDLHTVDNGVIDHIFPLLDKKRQGEWDLLIGHCLGVDHAGHRYGPNHAAMTAKLRQMDAFVRNVTESIDDKTLLIVMGDHGMDGKGDHGGESDDEVEAALWMYSKTPFFGRTKPEYAVPPATAKVRPVGQIDFVPTLALLLGLPIPFNNLGKPIEEAFAGIKGNDWANLAAVSKMAAAGIDRYQEAYFAARGITDGPVEAARKVFLASLGGSGAAAYEAFATFQGEVLEVCKGLWARFDVPRMIKGVLVGFFGLVVLMLYGSRTDDDEFVVHNNAELDYAEQQLDSLSGGKDEALHPDQHTHRDLLSWAWDVRVLGVAAITIGLALWRGQSLDSPAFVLLSVMLASMAATLHKTGKTLLNLLPTSVWGWMAVFFSVSHSVGFASNSYTVWEDTILLFFITTFAVCAAISSLRIESKVDRTMAIYHAVAFALLGRLASFSKLCREEQMPFCTSTYYASASSSTSAVWQLAIPLIVFAVLPSVIKSFMTPTRSYDGLAPAWIGVVFRTGVFLAALYWVIDAADNGDWLESILPSGSVKTTGVYVAQTVLAIAFVAGTTAFIWAPPSVSILTSAEGGNRRITIMGYANALGARYVFLPLNVLLACLVVTKPMGFGALALMMWQILSLAEVLDLNGIKTETIGPIMLAILGNFYFFKTGHQAVLASIQWDAAFIPLSSIRYPWTPIVVALNTCAGPIIAAASVPLLTMWKVGPKQKGVLETAARSAAVFVAYYAVEAVATMAFAGHLRRHLMLFRVFSPRFMMAALMLVVVDVAVLVFALLGVRANTLAISDVFEWAD